MYLVSPLFIFKKVFDGYEAVNTVSGKNYFINENLKFIIDKLDGQTEINDILADKGVAPDQIISTIDFLLTTNLIYNPTSYHTITNELVPKNKTLFGVNRIKLNALSADDIVFLGCPFGIGNTYNIDTQNFPNTLRESTSNYHTDLQENQLSTHFSSIGNFARTELFSRVYDIGDIAYFPGEPNSSYYEKINYFLELIFKKKALPIIIGGDHSITYPIIKSLSKNLNKFNIIHFDAHSDYSASSVLKIATNTEYSFLNHATFIDHCLRESSVQKIYQIGVRQPSVIHHEKIHHVSLAQLREKFSINEIISSELPIYITFDIDFLDPSIAPGTPTKINKGALLDETIFFLKSIISNKEVLGVDFVEVNPQLDIGDKTNQLSQTIILNIISFLKIKKNTV